MANAIKEAPLKKESISELVDIKGQKVKKDSLEHQYLLMEFDTGKRYMFQLAEENLVRELPVIDVKEKRPYPHKKFKPWHNIVLSSQIVWNGGRVNIRYYDGCTTVFASEQPKDKDVIDQLIKQTSLRVFQDGKFGVYGDETMLLFYLMICSWNVESPFRTRTANGIFMEVDNTKKAELESDKLDLQETALALAKEATETKMLIHANFLGIATMDIVSGNPLSTKEIRTEYRKRALEDSKYFIESYGNKRIELKYYIDKALAQGLISNKFNPNKATWAKSNAEICDISGLKSNEAIAEKLFEFSQMETGEEFAIQIKALYN